MQDKHRDQGPTERDAQERQTSRQRRLPQLFPMRQLRFLHQVIEHFTSRHHHPAPQSTLAHMARSRQQSQPDRAPLAEQTSQQQPSASPYLPLSLPVSPSSNPCESR